MPGPTPEPPLRRLVPIDDAQEAIDTCRACPPGPPLLFLPPPGAAGYLGLGWFHALQERLGDDGEIAVDCGPDPALALEALRQGFAHVIFTGEDVFCAELTAFAEQQGGFIYRRRP